MGREPGDSPEEPARLNGPSVSAVPYALFDRAALWCGPLDGHLATPLDEKR
jgi:hypothetical protein